MNQIFEKFLLKDKLEFKGSVEDLKKKINESRGRKYDIEWIANNEFKFLSKWSIGTLMIDYNPGAVDGIKGYGIISEKGNNNVEILLRTKLRIELYFLLGIFIIFFVGAIFMKEVFPFWVYFLLPICLIFFWWVLRVQENSLFKKVKQHLLS
tara:strand:+ start:265 stop:720 length:456 start_codon:yes stop_codon:yes gene_type:complete